MNDSNGKTDHDRVITSGAWWATAAFTALMAWLSVKVPYIVAWTVNTAVVCGVSYGMARYKRAWYAWLSFGAIAAVCAANGILRAATPLLSNHWSAASWVLAWITVWSWYWLIRIPRRHPPGHGDTHIWHHHVFHGAPGQAVPLPEWADDVPPAPGMTVPGEVAGAPPPGVAGKMPKAIGGAAIQPSAFTGRRGELAARLRRLRKN
jgi:hypothetical protein